MKLVRLEVQNYRSLFADETGSHLSLELGDGVNSIVGPNNCGKSNIFRALAVALDPDFKFDRRRDMPAPATWAKPTVNLTFQVPKRHRTSQEKTLLRYLDDYERGANPNVRETFASQGLIRYRVRIEGGEESTGTRREMFVASGAGARSLPSDDPLALKAVEQFRKCFHFVLIESGQNLSTLLEGKFKDILRSVLREQLAAEYAQAERHRSDYVDKIRGVLLRPLTERISEELRELFPEVQRAELRPEVSGLDETLTRMKIDVTDLVATDLADKGTGVRGGVLVAMLRHLADSGKRSMLFAVEEPEAFLHPGAQELLREDLEALADRDAVSLLVTTHSPFIVSRRPEARVFALDKDAKGRTSLLASAEGSRPQAGVLGGLFRDRLVVDILDRVAAIPSGAAGVLVVEGYTDEAFLRLATSVSARSDLISDLSILQAGTGVPGDSGGAGLAVMQALVAKATSTIPVGALFDADAPGKAAAAQLREVGSHTKVWKIGQTIHSYADVFPSGSDFPYEAEDLWPNHLFEAFLAEKGEDGVLKSKTARPKNVGGWQFDLTTKAKPEFVEFLKRSAGAEDCGKWVELLVRIRAGLGLPGSAAVDAQQAPQIAAAEASASGIDRERARTLWPLPGGRDSWRETLDQLVGFLRDGGQPSHAAIQWLIERFPSVSSEKVARSYWNVPASLGLVAFDRGSVSLTQSGREYLASPTTSRLASVLMDGVWGAREVLDHLAQSEESLSSLLQLMNDWGAGWSTDRQVFYRLHWMEIAGLVRRNAGGLWTAVTDGAQDQAIDPSDHGL